MHFSLLVWRVVNKTLKFRLTVFSLYKVRRYIERKPFLKTHKTAINRPVDHKGET